jgi:putative ABC transport system permease protein
MERFKEIGALKAVGWTNFNVMRMIFYESIFIGILGGIVGVVFGSIAAQAFNGVLGLNVLVTIPLIIEAFTFAVVISFFAAFYPAYYASKLTPVEALRG